MAHGNAKMIAAASKTFGDGTLFSRRRTQRKSAGIVVAPTSSIKACGREGPVRYVRSKGEHALEARTTDSRETVGFCGKVNIWGGLAGGLSS
jgi:hypothetical protein